MALSSCDNEINENGMELIPHGTTALPIACYLDDMCKQDVPWHWHEELEAVYVAEGTLRLSIGESNQTMLVSAGDGFFINAQILHSAKNTSKEPCFLHSLVFHPRLVGGSVDSIFWQKYVLPVTQNEALPYQLLSQEKPWHKELLTAIDRTWETLVEEPAGYEFAVRSALSSLFFALNSHCPNTPSLITTKELRQAERIKQMLQYIHTHYAEEISTQDIARSVALSHSETLRCFHNTIGTTPIQYLLEYRIQKAADLIAQTDDKISDIAASCGFHEMSYFTKCFKKIKNYTPTDYRKQKR